MKRYLAPFAGAFLLTASLLSAQAQQPKPKTQKEVDALQKVQAAAQANNPDGEIQAINYVLENFTDTEYKPMLLTMGMEAASAKGDQAQLQVFGERALESDPNNIQARVLLAESIAGRIRENDLDKEQNLKKAEDYANKALELLKANPPAPAGTTEAQWPDFKKQLTSQAYDALGQTADLRKKYPDAIQNYKTALDTMPTNSVAMARLSKAYLDAKQYDDAISTADKVLAIADAPQAVKSFAQQIKDSATKMKSSAPAAPAPK